MKPTRTEKQQVLQDVIYQLQGSITPFHTSKEKVAIERRIEVLKWVQKDYEVPVVEQKNLF